LGIKIYKAAGVGVMDGNSVAGLWHGKWAIGLRLLTSDDTIKKA
jgi:hypothetical protein